MRLRLGSIEFINSLPVDWGVLSGAVPLEADWIQGSPAVLNEKISSGRLEMSPVSSFWYAGHQKEFLLLPDLSISSESGVKSVLLFARPGFRTLKKAKIAVSGHGRTTPALLEILCRLCYGVKPHLEVSDCPFDAALRKFDGLLLIGDEALGARERLGVHKLEVLDLAEEWRRWTGLPIVFAVWVVRREIFARCPEDIFEAHRALLVSKRWGLDHLEEILLVARNKTGLPVSVLSAYFSRLSYDFGEELKKGMRLYFDYAQQCGLLSGVDSFEEIPEIHDARRVLPLRQPNGCSSLAGLRAHWAPVSASPAAQNGQP